MVLLFHAARISAQRNDARISLSIHFETEPDLEIDANIGLINDHGMT